MISAKIDAKNVARSVNKIRTDFNAMNVAELEKYLQVLGDLSEQIVENLNFGIASAVEKLVLPMDPNFKRMTLPPQTIQ